MSVLETVKSYFCLKNKNYTYRYTWTPGHVELAAYFISRKEDNKAKRTYIVITEYKRNYSTNVDHSFGWILFPQMTQL